MAFWNLTLLSHSLGKIPYYTMPPTRNDGELSEANIVSELGKEFNVDEVYGTESSFIGSLKSASDFNPVEVPSNDPVSFDEKMLEVRDHSKLPPNSRFSFSFYLNVGLNNNLHIIF